MSGPFKMKGFSGFGNSPTKQNQLFDVMDDGATAADIETGYESAVRSHAPLGDAVDILRARKGDPRPPTDRKIKEAMEYSAKHGHRKPTEWEKIKSDFTGKSEKEIITGKKKK